MNEMRTALASFGPGLPADCPEWAEVVAGAYGLERREILAEDFRAWMRAGGFTSGTR